MKNKTILGLLLVVCVWDVTTNSAQTATTCDRECLRAKVTQLLYAFLKHDVRGLPVAGTLRVTEDAVEKPLAKIGLFNTVTRLRGFRHVGSLHVHQRGVVGAVAEAEDRTDQEKRQLAQYEQILKSYEQTTKYYESLNVDTVLAQTTCRLRVISSRMTRSAPPFR